MNISDAKNIPLYILVQHLGGKYSHTDGNRQMWYFSPFRPNEKTASFKVNEQTNRWYDFGHVSRSANGSGGDVIDLWCDYYAKDRHAGIKEALQALTALTGKSSLPSPLQRPKEKIIGNKEELEQPRFKIIKLHERIFFTGMLAELERRRISVKLANKYLKQVYLHDLRYPARKQNGFAFPNDKGGYEISIPNPQKGTCFKTSIKQKSPTTFRNRISTKLLVFEGMWDFLSWLEMQGNNDLDTNVIVLNSLSFCGLVVQQIIGMKEQIDTVTLFLDNDDAGQKAKYFMEEELDIANFNVRTMEQLYKGYEDLNEYWVMQK